MRAAVLVLGLLVASESVAQPPPRGEYDAHCARCHGGDGRGGPMGPPLAAALAGRSDDALASLVREGLPGKGMPPVSLAAGEWRNLLAFLRSLMPPDTEAPVRTRVTLSDGTAFDATIVNDVGHERHVRDASGRLRLLRRSGDGYREVTSTADWPGYHGQAHGNRHSALDQITSANVARLAPAWIYPIPGAQRLQVTPVVVGGVMYVTSVNECHALDAGSGRRLWQFKRARTKGLAGDAAAGINRGVAVAGDRVFLATDDARLLALDRHTGVLLWETEMADWRQNYGATSAPLAVGALVVSGISGGDEGVRGFLAAFDQQTGREVWRFWTVPKAGEPGSETWKGRDIEHGCASTWLTGTYDAALDTLYWPTGNPCPDYDGAERVGDNLYSDAILALDPATGRLKWHFQYTPHDLWDWDAQQPPVLVDATWRGVERRLLLHANRNGFFYVLDRVTGALLQATPFVKKLTWASGIGADGRPILNPDQAPTSEGTTVCPAVEGATNWFSTAFNPATGLYYVQALEKCTIYARSPSTWKAGSSYYSGSTRTSPGEPGTKVLRAIDLATGAIRWERPQAGAAESWGGTLSLASGLVFYGDDNGALAAADAATGAIAWQFNANVTWKASPMTYAFDGRQFVAAAAGPAVIAFALTP